MFIDNDGSFFYSNGCFMYNVIYFNMGTYKNGSLTCACYDEIPVDIIFVIED